MAKQLGPYNLSYRVQKRYIPENGKPQIGNLHVMRYPSTGEIEFCFCRWDPLQNGTAQAFELAIDSIKKMQNELTTLTTGVKSVTTLTPEESWVHSTIRIAMKHPKIAFAVIASVFALGGSDAIINTLQRLGFIDQPPVVVKESK